MSPDQIELQEAFRTDEDLNPQLEEALSERFNELVYELRRYHEADANPQASDDLARKTLLAKVITFLESLNSKELE